MSDFPQLKVRIYGDSLNLEMDHGEWEPNSVARIYKHIKPIMSEYMFQQTFDGLNFEIEQRIRSWLQSQKKDNNLYYNSYIGGKWEFEDDSSECLNNMSINKLMSRGYLEWELAHTKGIR